MISTIAILRDDESQAVMIAVNGFIAAEIKETQSKIIWSDKHTKTTHHVCFKDGIEYCLEQIISVLRNLGFQFQII